MKILAFILLFVMLTNKVQSYEGDEIFELDSFEKHSCEDLDAIHETRRLLKGVSEKTIRKYLKEFSITMKKNKISDQNDFLSQINVLIKNFLGSNVKGIEDKTLLDILEHFLRLVDLPNKLDGLKNIEELFQTFLVLKENKVSSIKPCDLEKILKVVVDIILDAQTIKNILQRLLESDKLKSILEEAKIPIRVPLTTAKQTATTSKRSTTTRKPQKTTVKLSTTTPKPQKTTSEPSSTLSNNYPGLANNYPINSLTKIGFRIVYEQLYSDVLSTSSITQYRSQCDSDSIICVGGSKVGSDFLHLVACANCLSVLTETSLNCPRKVGSVFWYLTPKKSFGFAPIFQIKQHHADSFNKKDNSRLSWNIDLNVGGWRLGNIHKLNKNKKYKKYIFIRQ